MIGFLSLSSWGDQAKELDITNFDISFSLEASNRPDINKLTRKSCCYQLLSCLCKDPNNLLAKMHDYHASLSCCKEELLELLLWLPQSGQSASERWYKTSNPRPSRNLSAKKLRFFPSAKLPATPSNAIYVENLTPSFRLCRSIWRKIKKLRKNK